MARSRLGTVILFARTPRYGRGKRRLARDVGDLAALRFYKGALARTAALVAREAGWNAVVALDPPREARRPGPPFAHGAPGRLPRRPQRGRDLGQRMLAALRDAPPGPVVLIGADIEGVSAGVLRQALIACRAGDLVLGPATDGGFWLIGMRRKPMLRALDGVRWSTRAALQDTVDAVPGAWRIRFAARLRDVDNGADLENRRG